VASFFHISQDGSIKIVKALDRDLPNGFPKFSMFVFAKVTLIYFYGGASKIFLSRPIYIDCTVRNIILARFIYVKILEWNVNKSAIRLYVYAPKVEHHLQFFADFTRVNIKYIFTLLSPYFFLASTVCYFAVERK
jgi:hypothetical protein